MGPVDISMGFECLSYSLFVIITSPLVPTFLSVQPHLISSHIPVLIYHPCPLGLGASELYVVKSGTFEVLERRRGQNFRVNSKGPGNVFGEIALM